MTTESDRIFLDQFNIHFDQINEALGRTLETHVPLLENIGNHSLLGEGKRLRPLLFVLSSLLCGYKGQDLYHTSTIFEYIHTASLLHDDVIDNAHTRRKKPSANHVWGNSAAVLSGDFLYSKSFSIAAGCNNIFFMKVLTDTTTRMAEGQVLELVQTQNWKITKDEYMEIIISKTAVLISAACACGAIISGAGAQAVEHLAQFGLNLGIGFQLVDDLLDYTSCQEEIGKPVGKDLREGKITLPLIYTLTRLDKAHVERLEDLFRNQNPDEDAYREVITLVRNNGIIETIRSEAEVYAQKATSFLTPFPESPLKDKLMNLNAYIIQRSF